MAPVSCALAELKIVVVFPKLQFLIREKVWIVIPLCVEVDYPSQAL